MQNESVYTLNLLSKYRGQLMGLAALFIMICHNSVYHPYSINFGYIRPFFQCGVDIFLLLSGIGCFYSFAKTPETLRFYKKRFIRLVPTYLIFVLIYGIWCITIYSNSTGGFLHDFPVVKLFAGTYTKSAGEFLHEFSVISFFTANVVTIWFVGAIIVLYLLFPLIYRLVLKSELAVWLLILALYVINYIPALVESGFIYSIFTLRIPSFLLGVMIGKRIRSGEIVISNKKVVLSFVLTAAIVALFIVVAKFDNYEGIDKWSVFRTLFFPLVYFWSVSLVCLFEKLKLDRNKAGRFLSKIGEVSFETYLIHVPLLGIFDKIAYRFINIDAVAGYVSNIGAMIVAVLLGFALKWLATLAVKPLNR